VDSFTKKYSNLPTAISVTADICMTIYLEAVKSTNGDAAPDKVNAALHKIKVNTTAGTFSFRDDGLGIADMYILKVGKVSDRLDWSVVDKYSQHRWTCQGSNRKRA